MLVFNYAHPSVSVAHIRTPEESFTLRSLSRMGNDLARASGPKSLEALPWLCLFQQQYTFTQGFLYCLSLHMCMYFVICVCTRVCTCMYKPEDNLGCHPQEGCPPPLRQGLIGLQPTHKTRQRGPPVFTPLALRVQVCTTMPDIFTRVLGVELWSSLTIEATLGALWHIFTTSETSAG